MGRYLTGGVMAALAFGTLMAVATSEGLRQQVTSGARQGAQVSRDALSATSAAASDLTPLEQAGQAAQRQSDAQIGSQGNDLTSDGTGAEASGTTPTDGTGTNGTSGGTNGSGTPATPTGTTPAPIPALW